MKKYNFLDGFVENIEAWDAESWSKIHWRRTFSKEQKNEIWAKSNKRCSYCNKKLSRKTAVFDHIHSWKKGGATETSNGTPACHSCNIRKGHGADKASAYNAAGMFFRKVHEKSASFRPYFYANNSVRSIFKEARNGS